MYRSRMSLGDRMRAARIAAKLTQSELAARLGISRAAVSLFESGKSWPSAHTLLDFATITGASLDYVVLGKQPLEVDARIRALPDALREYVLQSLAMAEKVRARLPDKFIIAPTSATYQQFHNYLTELSAQVNHGSTPTIKR